MKKILIILLFPFTLMAQKRAYQTGNFSFLIDPSTTNTTPSITGSPETTVHRWDIRTGTTEGQGTLLLTMVDGWLFWFNATPSLSNFTQIGTTAGWLISIPTVTTTTKSLFIPSQNIVITYNGNNYTINTSDPLFYPVTITRNSDNALMCQIDSYRGIYWPNNTVYTASPFSTTGIIIFALN